jgi:hypothetical protein
VIGVDWAYVNGRWHAISGDRLRCGGRLMAHPLVVTSTEEDPIPPDPCARCLLVIASDVVVDEPMDEAKARGYLPASPDPG